MLFKKKRTYADRLSSRVNRMSEGDLTQWTETVFADLRSVLSARARVDDDRVLFYASQMQEAAKLSETLTCLIEERARRTAV